MLISEVVAAVVATLCYKKYKHLPIRNILIILWIAIITEALARVVGQQYGNNHGVYNAYSFIFYILFYKIIYDHITNSLRKKIVLLLSIVMLIAIIIRGFTVPVLTHYMSILYNIAMIVLVFQLLYYAIDRLKADAPLRLKSDLELYVFVGYLVFGLSFIPISFFTFGQMGVQYSEQMFSVLRTIQTATLVLCNAILVFGFLYTTPENR